MKLYLCPYETEIWGTATATKLGKMQELNKQINAIAGRCERQNKALLFGLTTQLFHIANKFPQAVAPISINFAQKNVQNI